MKKLSVFALSSVVTLLMSCSGGSNSGTATSDAQERSVENQPVATEPQGPPQEVTQKVEAGKQVYTQYCLACHQADGNGVQGAFPPLSQSDWVNGDNTRLITVLLNGLQGPIEVKGQQYNSMMPTHSFLSDEQIADVLTYVRNSFDNDGGEITLEEVKKTRDAGAADNESSN